MGGVLLYSLTGLSPTVLAAQLTLDHVKCFAVHDSDAPVDVRASEEQYARDYGGDDSSAARAPSPGFSSSACAGVFAAKESRRTRCIV